MPQELFQGVDMILLSNSYWLGEDVPCLTYGLRGVIHAKITVNRKKAMRSKHTHVSKYRSQIR